MKEKIPTRIVKLSSIEILVQDADGWPLQIGFTVFNLANGSYRYLTIEL